MYVSSLSLRDFRNHKQTDINLDKGFTVFIGKNGQGKTNLVEAINYLATLGSHRISLDSGLIRQMAESTLVRCELSHQRRTMSLSVQLNKTGKNKAHVNGTAVKISDLPRYISVVFFAPEDLMLIKGEPSNRRKFMDELIVQRTPRLLSILQDYDRVLKQRNTLLKSASFRTQDEDSQSTLDIWDERLVEAGTIITRERERLISDIQPLLQEAYSLIAGSNHETNIVLRKNIDAQNTETYQEKFIQKLRTNRTQEMDRGQTLVGPHRDDLELLLNGLPTKGYASHGETWSYALSLKLAAAKLLRTESVLGDPILILDDVFAELDSSRRTLLSTAISDYEQVLITAAVEEDVPEELLKNVFLVSDGQVALKA